MLDILEKNAQAKYICTLLEDNGYEAYCVGGCVRDALMDKLPNDIDITTSALPDEICQVFSSCECKIVKTGIKHGTISIILGDSHYEITTMRSELGYADSRHPDNVSFIKDIETDLSRRDFTINAMAYSYSKGNIVDPFGGKMDLQSKVLRCVGDPVIRFEEDSLRILRGIRFVSRLGFSVDPDTENAMRQQKDRLNKLAFERVYAELKWILCGNYAGKAVHDYAVILAEFIPEISNCIDFDQNSKYHCFDLLTHICKVIDNVPAVHYLRLAALFHDIGKPSCYSIDESGEGHFYGHAKESTRVAMRVLELLKVDNDTKDKVLFLVSHHDTPIPQTEVLIKKLLSKYGVDKFRDLIQIAKGDCIAQHPMVRYRLEIYDSIENTVNKIIEEGQCFGMSDLAINGRDLINCGIPQGIIVGKILSYILNKVLDGEAENKKESLIDIATEYYHNYRKNT